MQKNTKASKTKKTTAKISANVEKTTKTSTNKAAKVTNNKATAKKNSSKKSTKTTNKKATSTKTKTTTAKKTSTKKSTTTKNKNSVAKKTSTSKKKKPAEVIEYYDLPYRYNQTVVKILAQTPNTLFVYWDISDKDREKYIKEFGENFFETTKPVLIVHNKTMNYSFEVEINDFANSWYFNVNDSKCNYEIELGRRPKNNEINLPNNYMPITYSNTIETPNNHILFEKNQKVVFFRNVKTNNKTAKNVVQFNFMKYAGKSHGIYDIYKKIYTEEELENTTNNPSSNI